MQRVQEIHRDLLHELAPFPCGHRTSCSACVSRTIGCCTCWQLLVAIQQLDAAALACVMLTCNARYVSTTFYEGLLLGKLGYSHHSRYTSTESKHTALGYAVVVANAHAEDNPVGSLRVIATLLGAGVDPTAMSWVAPNLNWLDRTPADYLSVPLCVLGASNVQPF